MISLNELREKDEITTGEALLAAYRLTERYINVLNNIIQIKQRAPEEAEGGFLRSRSENTELLTALRDILFDLEKELKDIELELIKQNHPKEK